MIDEAIYGAFFDELNQIEKQAMLAKVAMGPLARAGMQFVRRPAQTAKSLGRIAETGYKAGAGGGGGVIGGVKGATKQLWATPAGKVALIGGGAAAGAGALGAAHLSGRAARRR